MKLLGIYLANRKFLLPLVLTVTVFFISQGISVPNFSNPQETRLSKPQETKQRPCAVVKAQIKYPQSRAAKTAQFFDLCSNADVFDKPSLHISAFYHESRIAVSVADSAIPARAPPV